MRVVEAIEALPRYMPACTKCSAARPILMIAGGTNRELDVIHRDGRWLRLDQVRAAARRLLDAPPGVGERMRGALTPVLDWFQSDEHDERPTVDILRDVVAELQSDRADVLRLRRGIQQIRDDDAVPLPLSVSAALNQLLIAAPAPAEPERAKHIPVTVPIYRNGRVEYVPPIEAPHVCGMSGFNPMKGDTCERCDAERFAREAPAASSAAAVSVATGEGGE
jgi:hypothetical protein